MLFIVFHFAEQQLKLAEDDVDIKFEGLRRHLTVKRHNCGSSLRLYKP